MWKPLFVLAVAASTFFITPSEGSSQSSAASSAFSSSYSSSGSSKSSASSSATSSSRGSSSKGNGGSGKPKCTKPNEVYDICPAPCPPRLCSVDERLIRCAAPPKPGDPECKPGCRCADGFVRNPQGFCVTRDQCPSKCGKNEVFSECPYFECRPQECSQVGYPLECATDDGKGCPGEPACICDDGFVRNKKGQCAPIENCPSCGGDPNAEAGCGVNCNKHCSDRNNTEPSACILVCFENACDCKDGFLYDDNRSKCVRPEECTASCGVNEIFSPCSNGGCGPWTCADVGYPTGCVKMDQKYCKEGCVCADGYVRENGICIPSSECPSCGGDPNATPGCGINCGRLCSNYNKKPVACPAVCLHNACDCKKGFVFDENRKICVRPKDCTPTCGNHEVFSECVNGGCEAKNCSQLGKPVPCVRPRKCIPGCLCEDGYLRAANGTCIPKDQCQIKCTGANEIYDPCPPICPPQTCDSIGQKYFCPLMPANKNSKDCHGACRCKPNYLRNKIGECISGKDCLKCTGPNEYFSCGGACDNVCATLSQQNQTNCPIVNFKCNPMCYCEEGYARDANNICIPIDECTDQTCGVNERLEQCPDWLCEPQSCKQIGFPLNCPDLPDDSSTPCPGPPACVCDYNFVRDKNGKCIPVKQCPSCGGDPNAESGCGLNCGRLCSNYDKGPVACPRICFPNSCDCKQGFVYDENIDQCVRPNQCTPVCGDDEQYSECVNGGCEARNCSQLGKPIPCVKKDPKSCIKGCICEEGSLRAANGTCVPEEDCDHCNKPHEHYDPCAPSCPPQTCESIGKVYHCPISPAVCKGACRCDKGFLRNKIGNCISEKDCLKCTGPHEFFSCGGACDNVCATLSQQNQTNCPIINFKCNPMCYCEDGYARDKNNICIPIEKCPPSCGVNERLESCPNPSCFPHKCSEVGFPIACADIPEGGCTGPPVCVCIDNYVRNDKGKCIPIKNCPSCGGDPNAVSGCGSNCGRLCSNYKKKNVICSLICKINGCDCRDGFVYDNNLKKCVRPEDCTPICGINEVYVGCANGGCDKRNCSQIGQPDLCIDPIKCIGGCVCQKGFLRTDNGTCVPEDQCPPSCGVNERLISCPNSLCVPQKCTEVGFPVPCADIPEGGCSEPPVCVCIANYVRNDKGKCIPIQNCPSCGGDPNAVSGCGSNCGRLCSNYKKKNVICSLICEINGCDCRDGFVYDNNLKKCVRPEDCTPICGINEVYVDCANGGCDKRNCSQIEQPDLCIDPIKCIGGCVCQKRFLRTDNGTCVPEDQCPRSCTKKHEVYDPCPPNCPPETCDSIGESYSCPADVNVNCVGACRCVKGYRRNEIGECISEDDCLKCTGPNEHFSCGGACDNVCATLQQQNQTNCPIINKRCTSKCYCNEGYARDGNGICIPIEQCGVSCHGDPNAIPGCGNHCGVSCSDYDKNYIVCPAICYEHSCNCKESYVYDEIKKICVQPQDCTPSCEVNEVFDECANGGCRRRKCSDPSIICINPTECIGDCVCVEGYLYNGDGICVPENKCNEPTCGTNEVYNPCPSTCPPQTCESLDKVYICPIEWGQEPPCEPDCVCQEGFYRNKKGECISQEDCLKCMGPHEYFSCRSACDNVCATLNEQNQTNCPIVNIVCNPMCYCEEGYARNADNICIPISDCPEPRCGPNERYEENPSTYCEPLECSELGFPIDCPRDEDPDCEDEPICICKYGYVRDAYGICIPKTECPSCGGDPNAVSGCGIKCGDNTCADYGKNVTCLPMCYTNGCDCRKGFLYDEIAQKCVRYGDCTTCRANEVYDPCPSTCPPQTCESLDKVYICPIEWGQEPSCEPDCVCKKGFYRNKIGECISEADCLKCMGPHEYFSCRGVCDNVCATLNEQNQTNCPIVNIICNPMCYCEEGYARDDDNICIPIEDCSEPRCGPNEIYEENPSTYCEPLTCSELGFPIDCPRDEKPDCEDEPICICKFGYVRNACGICIPKTECPSCGGDPNAISGCGIKCGNTCADYGKNVTCLPMCYTNGCDCRKGLVYDGITKKCVRYEDCTPTTTSSPPSTVNSTEARARLDIGSTILANEFLYQIISSKPNENSVSSATSVMVPLAQLTLWSTGVVLEQLLKLLNLKSKDEIKSVFPELTKSYENQQNVVFEVATKYYANKGFPLSQNFISTSREYFDAGGENIDFGQNVAAANTINKWVSNRTHDKIQNLVSPDMFNSATRLVLVNAIYFNGNWIYQFNPNNTETKDFYKSNGKTVSVKMMYQQNSFNYAENEKYQALQMFYKGNVFSFLVILPRKVNGLMETVKAFQDPKEFTNMRNSLTRQKVQVYLPKMNIDTQLDISEILKKINITAMFDPGNNGFEGILERNEPVYVSTAIQKATITVNEIGTEAAAATAITVLASAVLAEPPKIYEFNGNHNFIYYLLFDDVPMFSGCFVGAE